jgi:transposase
VQKTLSNETIRNIRLEFANGTPQTHLSKKYGVSRGTIQNYIRGYTALRKTTKNKDRKYSLNRWNILAEETYKKLSEKYAQPYKG